ncbi:putative MFS-type transporter [Cladophialophora carrionii]|uniref:Putative MFS-type transporter n=1 Tax=Cladophialophora carrionii TaxID=86049 RepID=A0A1C1CKG1_9EURO|nr:putative MFS-type transporter [Cladophialophora carrionii]
MADPQAQAQTQVHSQDHARRSMSRTHTSSENLVLETTNSEYGDLASPDDDAEKEKPEGRLRSSFATGRSNDLNPSLNLQKTVTRRETILSRIRSRPPLGNFNHPLEHQKTTVEDLVDFDGPDDPYRPLNWAMGKKVLTTALYGFTTMSATWGSSAYSPGTEQVARQFHVGTQTSTLGTTLFLFGFGLGPLLWAPLSEVYGRKNAVLPPMFVAAMFSFGSGAAKDIQTVMITRFFAGFFASAPVTNTGGVLADLFPASQRGIAIATYAMAVVLGPVFGPIIGAALVVQRNLGWRWTEYLTGIIQLFFLSLDVIFLDESYPPRLLVYKARRLRHQSGNWALHAKFEEWDVSIQELANKPPSCSTLTIVQFLVRPFQLLTTPICALVALYASFCYGILYMQLGAIPIIFAENRHWKQVPSELPFLAILLGAVTGAAINIFNQILYNRKAGGKVAPELRLPPMMFGSFLFAAGLFVTGWTADPSIHWIAPVIGLYLAGLGFFTIFQAALNYLVDTFQKYAASAVAANTFLRSCFAGA